MAKGAGKKPSGSHRARRETQIRAVPDWPLFGLALLGMGLAAYLTVTAWRGEPLAGCPAGTGCDIVLNSRWARLFGLPTSLWGFLLYAALAGIAWIRRADIRWKLAWLFALVGFLYSLYLTFVSFFELKAACPYCLGSLALMGALLATTVYQRPRDLPGLPWRPWLVGSFLGAAVIVVGLHLHYAGLWGTSPGSGDPRLDALAEHLTRTGAKFYGASWCPHCVDQKQMFGSSAGRLPYVECSPLGSSSPQAPACRAMEIKSYPTWIINGQRIEGVLTVESLERYSGFSGFK